MTARTRFESRATLLVCLVVALVVAAPAIATAGASVATDRPAGAPADAALAQTTALAQTPDLDALDAGIADERHDDLRPIPLQTGPVPLQTGGAGASETEPNDDPATATPISPGSPVEGSVSTESDLDFYAVDVTQPTTLDVGLSRTAASGVLAFVVFDPAGEFLDGSIVESGDAVGVTVPVNASGRYVVLVASGSAFSTEETQIPAGTGDYTLTVAATGERTGPPTPGGFETPAPNATQTPAPNATPAPTPAAVGNVTEIEPNDDPANATPLPLGSRVAGTIDPETDVDFYAVDVAQATTLDVALDRGSTTGDLAVVLADSALEFVDGDFVQTSLGFSVQLQPGRYFVLVASGATFRDPVEQQGPPGSGPYALTVSTPDQPPVTATTPAPTTTPGPTTPTTPGPATPTTPTPGTVTPEPFGTPVPSDGNETASETEPNDEFTEANALTPGVPVEGALASPDDVDWFAFDASAGAAFNATLSRPAGDGSFRVIYYDANGSILEVAETVVPGDRSTFRASVPAAQRLFVRVDSADGSGPYRLVVSPAGDAEQAATRVDGGPSLDEVDRSDPNETTAANGSGDGTITDLLNVTDSAAVAGPDDLVADR